MEGAAEHVRESRVLDDGLSDRPLARRHHPALTTTGVWSLSRLRCLPLGCSWTSERTTRPHAKHPGCEDETFEAVQCVGFPAVARLHAVRPRIHRLRFCPAMAAESPAVGNSWHTFAPPPGMLQSPRSKAILDNGSSDHQALPASAWGATAPTSFALNSELWTFHSVAEHHICRPPCHHTLVPQLPERRDLLFHERQQAAIACRRPMAPGQDILREVHPAREVRAGCAAVRPLGVDQVRDRSQGAGDLGQHAFRYPGVPNKGLGRRPPCCTRAPRCARPLGTWRRDRNAIVA